MYTRPFFLKYDFEKRYMVKFIKENGLLYILGLAIFFSLVHYRGFDKDAAIYLLQAMNYLQPERFVNDVPFMFGNQDSFSIFSPVVAFVFKILGVNAGGMLATLFMLFVLCVALSTFVFRWGRLFKVQKWTLPIALSMFVLLGGKVYGSGSLYLPYFEPYLVARVFSEILIVAGLIFFFDKNRYLSLAFFVMASFMHPLMGGWAFLLWCFYHFPKVRVLVLVLSFLAPLSGFLHIGRLDFYSDDWKPLYLKPTWDELAVYLSVPSFWLVMSRHFKGRVLSKFSIALFWVSLAGVYLQFVGSYAEHLLLYQVQPFRVLWLSMIPVVPVYAFYIHDCVKEDKALVIKDYAILILGLFVIAGMEWIDLCAANKYVWLVLLAALVTIAYIPAGEKDVLIGRFFTRALFTAGFAILFFDSVVCNYIQLAIEQNLGNVDLALTWFDMPGYLSVIRMLLLMGMFLFCVVQKKYGYALMFAFAFCNSALKILPMVGLLLCIKPNLSAVVKKSMLAFSISFSFLEMVNSMYRFNSTETLPLEGNPLVTIVMFITLFVAILLFFCVKWDLNEGKAIAPFVVLIASLLIWDAYRWDSRDETIALNERQMDVFFEKPIFAQVKDRGKLLFAVDYETPIQSRINFMTGAYADESIYVGEVFYKEQFVESNRRRSALLTGSSQMAHLGNFSEKMMNVYHNPDTLLSRVHYLCAEGEITHFASDYANMPLPKEDSVFLDVKQKYVWLYGCKK